MIIDQTSQRPKETTNLVFFLPTKAPSCLNLNDYVQSACVYSLTWLNCKGVIDFVFSCLFSSVCPILFSLVVVYIVLALHISYS